MLEIVLRFSEEWRQPAPPGDPTMIRVIAALACTFAVAGCTSMPNLNFFNAAPAAETLRIESEPPGAEARTAEGQNCLTPCEVVVPPVGETVVAFALRGYQPLAIPVRREPPGGALPARLQPNPVYAELQPILLARPTKKAPAKRKQPSRTPAAQPAVDSGSLRGVSPWPAQ